MHTHQNRTNSVILISQLLDQYPCKHQTCQNWAGTGLMLPELGRYWADAASLSIERA